MIYNDLSIILPEIFLSLYVMVALVGAVYTSKDEIAQKVTWFTAVVFILLAFLDDFFRGPNGNCIRRNVY